MSLSTRLLNLEMPTKKMRPACVMFVGRSLLDTVSVEFINEWYLRKHVASVQHTSALHFIELIPLLAAASWRFDARGVGGTFFGWGCLVSADANPRLVVGGGITEQAAVHE